MKRALFEEEVIRGDWGRDNIGTCVIRLINRLKNDDPGKGAKQIRKKARAVVRIDKVLNDKNAFMKLF